MLACVDDVCNPWQVVNQVFVHMLFRELLDQLVQGVRRRFAFFELEELVLLHQCGEFHSDCASQQLTDVNLCLH